MARPRLGEEERRGTRTVGVRVTAGRGGRAAGAGPRRRASRWARTCAGGGWGSGCGWQRSGGLGAAELRELEPDRGESQSNGAGAQRGSRVVASRDPGGGGACGGNWWLSLLAGESGVMVTKMSARRGARSAAWRITGLHDRWVPGLRHPESAERVEWTETRNLATEQGDRAAPDHVGHGGGVPGAENAWQGAAATGRKLEKPVCHYSLNWAKDEKPDRQEMLRAAERSLKALGMERHQALIVSHRDGQPHVHVIANRVDPESAKAAGLNRSKLRLSKWAERYEREQGKIRCPARDEE